MKKILVAGCGPKNVPPGAIGLDIQAEYIRIARDSSEGASFVVGDIERLPFADEVFDEVLCWEVLEHVPNKETVLAEFHRVLGPGKTLTMSTAILGVEKFLAFVSTNYRKSVLETQHRFAVPMTDTVRMVSTYFELEKTWFVPQWFAHCFGAACLLDFFGVSFNDAGEMTGANAALVNRWASGFARSTTWFFAWINKYFPASCTKSICISARRAKSVSSR